MSRNGFGPNIAASLFHTMKHSNCSLTDVNFTDNPIGTILIMMLDVVYVVVDDDSEDDADDK
jgi:hypothetical protein